MAPGGTVLAPPPPMYRQDAPRSLIFVVQAASESISPENGGDAGLERPAPPQPVVPAAVVYLSDRRMVVLVVLDVVVDVVVGAALLVVVVGAALLDVVVGAALLDVVVGAALLDVVVGAALLDVVVGAALLDVVVGASVDVVVVGASVDVVVGGGTDVVVLPGVGHVPPAPHASQQLGTWPTHAVPPCGALHSAALCLMLHFALPRASVRQQVTESFLPQTDFAAHRITESRQACRSEPLWTAASATWATQLT